MSSIEKDKDLGPDNKEARELMWAMKKVVDCDYGITPKETEEGELIYDTGVGKDFLGKYAYTKIKVEGKSYMVKVFASQSEKINNLKLDNLIQSIPLYTHRKLKDPKEYN